MSPRELVRATLRAGFVGGVTLVFLAMIGMVENFDQRNLVSNVVTLGKVLLALPPAVAGFVVVRPRVLRGEVYRVPSRVVPLMGLGAGGLAGGVLVAGVTAAQLTSLQAIRRTFVAASPKVVEIATFGRPLPLAAVILVLGGAALGLAGGSARLLPAPFRKPLYAGLVATLALGLLQRIVPPVLTELGLARDWLYSRRFSGLTVSGAIIVFVVAAAASVAWVARSGRVRSRRDALPEPGRAALRTLGVVAALFVLAILPLLVGDVLSEVLGTVGIFVLMGLGLNIVVGYAGLLDLGYVAFFAVGAYFLALLTGARIVTSLGEQAAPSFGATFSFWVAVWFVILIAAFTGLLIGAPVLRLRGDYLAIVTLGFGEIARVLATSDWLKPFTGGAQGLRDVPGAAIGWLANVPGLEEAAAGFRDPQRFYWLVLGFSVLAVYVSLRLANSRIGRAWQAMREDEQVAEAMGVSTIRYKLLAFAMGAAVGCLSGALFAVKLSTVQPDSFQIFVSIAALSVVILGGMGSIPGVIVGAAALIGIPELLREFEEFRFLLYGAVLVAIMILRPEGLLPNVRRMRELREEEVSQDAWLRRAEWGEVEASVGAGSGGEERR
jgi:branched-chain amino acid transport system permease protein